MTPPEAGTAGRDAGAVSLSSAIADRPTVLKRRADFLLAARGLRRVTPGFVLQARRRAADESVQGIRVGFTCSRKVGNAVVRNRAKRRLREAARLVLPQQGRAGWDYVLIGRAGSTVDLPFDQLVADLRRALAGIHGNPE